MIDVKQLDTLADRFFLSAAPELVIIAPPPRAPVVAAPAITVVIPSADQVSARVDPSFDGSVLRASIETQLAALAAEKAVLEAQLSRLAAENDALEAERKRQIEIHKTVLAAAEQLSREQLDQLRPADYWLNTLCTPARNNTITGAYQHG